MQETARSHTYLVECFDGSLGTGAAAGASDRLRSACAELRAAGTAVEYLGALLVPQDELVLHLFVSPGTDGVLEASRRADLRVERIVESLASGPPPGGPLVVPARQGGDPRGEQPTDRG